MHHKFEGKTALVTGGTKGVGLAVALEFAKQGAQVCITHRWGSVPDQEVYELFDHAGACKRPHIFQANVSDAEDTASLMNAMSQKCDTVDIYIANASSIHRIRDLRDYKKRTFLASMENAAWPLAAYTLEIEKTFKKFPSYIVGVSGYSTEKFHPYYDFSAMAKSAMETMTKYLATRLRPYGTRVNLVRLPWVDTQAPEAVFGKTTIEILRHIVPKNHMSHPQDIARTIVGLCSGSVDCLSGQILDLDTGTHFLDHSLGILEREELRQIFMQEFDLKQFDNNGEV